MADAHPMAAAQGAGPSLASRLSPRIAARALYLAAITLVASMVAISLFFGGAGAFWGPVNDLLVVATVLLLLPAMAALAGLAKHGTGRWFGVVTIAAVAGVMVIAIGQLALIVGLITLDTSFVTGGLGVLPIIAWVGATGLLTGRTPWGGRAVGGWAAAFLGLIGLTVVVLLAVPADAPTLTGFLGVPLTVTLLGWMLSLARALARADES